MKKDEQRNPNWTYLVHSSQAPKIGAANKSQVEAFLDRRMDDNLLFDQFAAVSLGFSEVSSLRGPSSERT